MFFKKIALLLLCLHTIINTMDRPKKPCLRLIATSTEQSVHKDSFLFKKIWSEDTVDTSYKKTDKGNAKIVSLESLLFDGTAEFNLEKNIIDSAYVVQSPIESNNTFGKCIQNIGRSMKEGSKIEIELHPSIEVIKQSAETIQSPFHQQHMKLDPFTAVIDANLLYISAQLACGKRLPNPTDLPNNFIAYTQKLSRIFENIITIYSEKKIGTKDQWKKRVEQELWLWKQLEENDYIAFLSHGPTASFEDFSAAIDNLLVAKTPISLHDEMLLQKKHNCFSYDSSTLLNESLLSFLICDAAIIESKIYIENFMHNNGFKDLWLSRKTSKRNGRTNVWILEAIKA